MKHKMMVLNLPRKQRIRTLLFILSIGICLFVLSLGSTGLVDETPPLFAAAGRNMSVSGDWITPRVNGLPRFDKPPLVYWLMGAFYSLPQQETWDPLGTWAARLPSAMASIFMMLILGDTLLCYPQQNCANPRRTAVVTSLAFALSPLVIIWSRIAVSDALLCGTFGISMLLQWRSYCNPNNKSWSIPWIVLGLAVLTKGPVSLVLMAMTFLFFGLLLGKISQIWIKLRPLQGLLVTGLVSLPWYLIEFIKEGKPFWDSFFGYHNFQRFTSVVNDHLEPWWYFGLILIIASLPFTPFLIYGSFNALNHSLFFRKISTFRKENTLDLFALCWLLSVFILFTFSATKLPSYWLPATPAAAILIGTGSSFIGDKFKQKQSFFSWILSAFIIIILALIFWFSPYWVLSIYDPEIPNLGLELLNSRILYRGAICLTIASIIGLSFSFKYRPGRLYGLQLPVAIFYLITVIPLAALGDRLRQLPLRKTADFILTSQKKYEPLAMVGTVKPSMHFYTRKVTFYEGKSAVGLVNLSERLSAEKRLDWEGKPSGSSSHSASVLVVIDNETSKLSHWEGLSPFELAQFGIYKVWRLDQRRLKRRANKIISSGISSNWRTPNPERF